MDSIAFDPPLPPAEVERWEHMKSVVKFLDHRHTLTPSSGSGPPSSSATPKPYIVLFVGSVPKGSIATLKNGERPSDFFDNDPALLPLCGMTTMTSILYSSAGVPTYQYKVDYDDKPAWYTTMQGNPKWNNKGQFPGAYISGVGFVTDSDIIIPMLKTEPSLASHFETIDLTPDLPEDVLNANPFFSLIPHMKGDTPGVVEKINSDFFEPLDAHLKASKTKYLASDRMTWYDGRLCYMILMANMVGLYFDGKSAVDERHTHLYAYMRSCMESDPVRNATEYTYIPPSLNVDKLVTTLTKYGMVGRTAVLTAKDLPMASLYSYLEYCPKADVAAIAARVSSTTPSLSAAMDTAKLSKFYAPLATNDVSTFEDASGLDDEDLKAEEVGMNSLQVKRFRRMLKKASEPLPPSRAVIPTFSPPLSEAEQVKFDKVVSLIDHLDRASDAPYIIIFIGSTPSYGTTHNMRNGMRPANTFSNDADLLPFCSFSVKTALSYFACDVDVHLFKISYDDKPAWYTAFDAYEGWDNKGSFPGSYIRTHSGSRWMSDSDAIVAFLRAEYPERVEALEPSSPPPVPCPSNIYEENVFFKTMAYIQGQDDPPSREILHNEWFGPLNDFFESSKFDFIDGDSPGLKDAAFAFFAMMVNMMGLYFEGKSFISKELTFLYSYLDRFSRCEAFRHSQGYEVVDPGTIMAKFSERIKLYGMELRPVTFGFSDMPLDCTHVYYELDGRPEKPTTIDLPSPALGLLNAEVQREESLVENLDAIGLKAFFQALSKNGIVTMEQARTLDAEDLKDAEIGMNNFQVKRFRKMCSGQIVKMQVMPQTPIMVLPTDRVVQKLPKSERRRRGSRSETTPKAGSFSPTPSNVQAPTPSPARPKPLPLTAPTFDPPLSSTEQQKFDKVARLIDTLIERHSGRFVLLFMGAVPRPADTKIISNGDEPEDFLDSDPSLVPLCGWTTITAASFASAGIPTYMVKVNYDDKPAWYTSISGLSTWNNKGQFPGAYVNRKWVTDSKDILKVMETAFPAEFSSISLQCDDTEVMEASQTNLMGSVIAHLREDDDMRPELNSEVFKVLDSWFGRTGNRYLFSNDTVSLTDCKFGYFLGMINLLVLWSDGESMIDKKFTHLYRYLANLNTSPAFRCASEYRYYPPKFNLVKLQYGFKKAGLDLKTAVSKTVDLPIDSTFTYYKLYKHPKKSISPAARLDHPLTRIAFQPSLSSRELERYQEVVNLVNHLESKNRDFVVLFIGGLKRAKHPATEVCTALLEPKSGVYANEGPTLLPICALTTLAGLLYRAAGIDVTYYTIDYDDKPAWYTTMQNNPRWNNKGTFPGCYFRGEFIMESDEIFAALKRLEPSKYGALDVHAQGLDKKCYEENVLFKIIPHISGGENGKDCRDDVNDAVLGPINEHLKKTGSRFLCGDEVKLPDIRVAYMISMVNIIGLFWDGKSFVRKEYTHLFEYLERFMSLDIMSETTCHLWIPPSVNLEKLVISLEKMGMNLRGRSISPGTVPLNATHKYYELAKGFERNKSFGLPAGGGVEQESANNIKEQGEDKNNDSNVTKSKAHGTGTPASRAVVVADTSQKEQPRDQSSSDFLKSRAPLTPEQRQRASRNFRSLRSRVTAIVAFKKSGRAAKIHGTDDDDDNDGGGDEKDLETLSTRMVFKFRSMMNEKSGEKKERMAFLPKVDRESLKSKTRRSANVNLAKNWYWLLLDSSWRQLSGVVIVVYAFVALFLGMVTLLFYGEIGGTDTDPGLANFEVSFIFIMTNLLSIGLGTFEPSGRATQILTIISYFLGLIINVLMFSIVVTKFQRPQAEIVFSQKALFSSRDSVPVFIFRLGNLRGNLLYYPKVAITLQTPIKTKEGESMMKMQNVPILTIPSTVSGSITFAHRIDEESPLKFITSEAKFQSLEEGDLIFSVAFSAFDSTFHSDIVSSKKYFVKDLGFAKRFGDIMESKDGVNFVNWTKFNTYVEVDAKEAYMNLAKLGRKPARQTIKAAVKTVATVNAVVHAAQGDRSAGGDDDEVSKTESDLGLGTGVSLAPAELSEVKSRPGQAVLFPHVTMTDAGDQLPVCTQTMSIALAMQFCGLRVKMYGVPADGVPKWHAGMECEEGGSDDPFIKRITAELGSAAQPEWSCAGCGDKFGQPLLSRDGVYFRGIEACLEACRKSSADVSRAMSELNASTPHGDWLLEIFGKLNASLLKFVQNGTKGELLQSKADLSSVLGELEAHLERYGNGGSGLLTGPKWHLLDCLIAPLVHRCSASLSYFEGSPLPGSAVNEYMALVCTEERWLASVATHDAAEASSSYIESLRLGLGKNVRPKKRRQSASICI